MLLCLDFAKAFDSVDWKFTHKVLRAFGLVLDMRKIGITVENNSSVDLIKTLKVSYVGQKGARLYEEVLTHDANKPNCCGNGKLN